MSLFRSSSHCKAFLQGVIAGRRKGAANTMSLSGKMMTANRRQIVLGTKQHKNIRFLSSASGDDDKQNPFPDPRMAAVSRLKNPIVHQLWTQRQRAKAEIGTPTVDDDDAEEQQASSSTEEGKPPSASEVVVEYPFSADEFLAESYRNPWGQMRVGKLMEDLDALAGNIAFFHVRGSNGGGQERLLPVIVTASIDRIKLRSRPAALEHDQVLSGRVTYVGSSSMEIRMQCQQKGHDRVWMEAYFTFVTLDAETHRPVKITPLLLETQQEQYDFDQGAKRAAIKKQRRKMENQPHDQDNEIQRIAKKLLEEARPLNIMMPSLADPSHILMSATKMQNALVAQPQAQNLHHRIFGGFLVRRAFELAFSTAYVFGGVKPVFWEVDEVSFNAPVDVGDLLVFNSRVLYTSFGKVGSDCKAKEVFGVDNDVELDSSIDVNHLPLVHIEVETWVTEPEEANARLSNKFYFTFCVPKTKNIRRVLPGNIDEATRMATRMEADRLQEEHDDDDN